MGLLKEIASFLNCTIEHASAVRNYIDDEWLLDWSEATTDEYHRAFLFAHQCIISGQSQ